MLDEANPNHPVTSALRYKWHVIAALLVAKAGGHVIIDPKDLARMAPGSGLSAEECHDGLHLRLVMPEDVAELARREGGLPT